MKPYLLQKLSGQISDFHNPRSLASVCQGKLDIRRVFIVSLRVRVRVATMLFPRLLLVLLV